MAEIRSGRRTRESEVPPRSGEGIRPRVVVDHDFSIVDADEEFSRLIGYSRSQLTDKNLIALFVPEDRPKLEEHFRIVADSAHAETSARLKTRNGFTLHVHLSSASSGNGESISLFEDETVKDSDEQSTRRTRYALALYEIGRQMTSSFDADEVLKLVVKNVAWLLECQFVAVAQADWDSDTLKYREVMGNKSELARKRSALRESGIAGRVTISQKPVIMHTPRQGTKFNGPDSQVLTQEGLRSAFGVPITNKGRQIGALVVGFRNNHLITDEEVELTTNLANQAALALENATLYQQSVEYSKSMAALTSRLTVIQEEERRRITRELHDGVGQALTGLRLNLDLLSSELQVAGQTAIDRVALMKQSIDETLNTIRQIAFDLRPPILDDLGLISALRVYADRFEERTKILLTLSCPEQLKRFDPKVEATVYRVIQEALTNVAKHSGARSARIEVKKLPQQLDVTISDDGKGFEVTQEKNSGLWSGGLGIINMKERIDGLNGRFSLVSDKGKGTTIVVKIPVHD